MKIGQFSDSFLPIVDGVGRVAYYYCDTLARRGLEVYAMVPMNDIGYRPKYPFEIIDYYSKTMKSRPYSYGVPFLDENFKARLDTKECDIVHVHTPFIAGMEGIHYAEKRHLPVVGTFHSKYYDDFLQFTHSRHLAELGTDFVVEFFNHCDEVWAVSESSAETLKSYGYKKEVFVIPNGMEKRDIADESVEKAKEAFHLTGEPMLLFVGQLNWKKNIRRVLEATSILHAKGVKLQLCLAGQGPHEEEIKKAIRELNIEDVTVLCGHITDTDLLDGLYKSASMFVFPSIYDNAPMVVREAANAFTPSICVRGSSAGEIIADQVNGYLCEDESNDLANVIENALSDPEKLAMVGEEARKTIPIEWTTVMETVVKRYENLIKKYQEDK